MNKNELLELKSNLDINKIIMCFSGFFSQNIIEDLGDALKAYCNLEKVSNKSTNNIFSIFIEQTQNIRNYISKKNNPDEEVAKIILNSGITIIGNKDQKYFIYSGNLIEKKDVKELIQKLDKIMLLGNILKRFGLTLV